LGEAEREDVRPPGRQNKISNRQISSKRFSRTSAGSGKNRELRKNIVQCAQYGLLELLYSPKTLKPFQIITLADVGHS
jgi:hypothetical protein